MTAKNNPEIGYEIIDETEIVSVKRGRKSSVDPALIEMMKKLEIGKVIRLNTYSVGTIVEEEDKKKAKASTSAKIRQTAKASGWKNVSIIWEVTGTPVVKRIA
jgi:hypothetical protein